MTEEIYYHVSSQAAYHVWNVFGFQEKFLFFIGSLILIYFIDPPKTNINQDWFRPISRTAQCWLGVKYHPLTFLTFFSFLIDLCALTFMEKVH